MTRPKELREAALLDYRPAFRRHLRGLADLMEERVLILSKEITTENLRALNGVWAATERALNEARVTPSQPPPPAKKLRVA